ncbi:unnamed protein product [Symbiodinium sp. CCMP2456]|nr:unnamed protein product [Symbiodinium sp. CCMP2456]
MKYQEQVTAIGTGIAPERVSSLAGEITLYLPAPAEALECELFRDSGVGDEPRFEVYRGDCEVAVRVDGRGSLTRRLASPFAFAL